MHLYRGPLQTDTYVLKGEGEEVWEPRFVYHGFRYVELSGYPGRPTIDSLLGLAQGCWHTAYAEPELGRAAAWIRLAELFADAGRRADSCLNKLEDAAP